MSEASALSRRSSEDLENSTSTRRSRSVPAADKSDPAILYTTPPDGIPPLLIFFLHIARDTTTFLVRGGLSTLMFSMDMVLQCFIFVFDIWLQLPGAFLVSYLARFLLWCYQLCMWIAYTILELTFYLPTPLMIVYLVGLCAAYYAMPEELEKLLLSMLWAGGKFFRVFKYLAFTTSTGSESDRYVISYNRTAK